MVFQTKRNFFRLIFFPRWLDSWLKKEKISRGVIALYANRAIQNMAVGLLGFFLPVFLLDKFQSINLVLLFYLVAAIFYLFLAAPGVMIASRITFRKALILSVVAGTLFYIFLSLLGFNLWLFSALAIVALTVNQILYWIPYHAGFAKFSDRSSRGRQVALITSLIIVLSAVMPFFAGLLISYYGFTVLFAVVILIYAASVLPFFKMPNVEEYYTFTYWQTWKILFHRRDRRILLTYMADAGQDFIGLVIWPIFIFNIFQGDYQAVGIVSSAIILLSIFISLAVGGYTDRFDKHKILKYGSILYSLGWLVKVFAQTGFHIFIVSTYHNFTQIMMRTPFDTLMYEKVADAGHYMDEYSVLRTMSFNLGRIVTIVVLLVLFNFFPLNYAFILAGVTVLLVNLI
ncbi:MAG: MFS transporter [Patescibacteria group bacterium]|jgi:YQGE family putative transporter|nr:MFS transporter [Patescibacteria group bacterium]